MLHLVPGLRMPGCLATCAPGPRGVPADPTAGLLTDVPSGRSRTATSVRRDAWNQALERLLEGAVTTGGRRWFSAP